MTKNSPKASTSHKYQQYSGITDSFVQYMEEMHISERVIAKNNICDFEIGQSLIYTVHHDYSRKHTTLFSTLRSRVLYMS